MRATLTLPYPPTANNLYRNTAKGRVKTSGYIAWLKEAGWLLAAQHPSKVPGRYRLWLFADAPDLRARDVDNLLKPVSDLLKKGGVIEDDSKAKSVFAEWSEVAAAKPGGIRVEIEPYTPPPEHIALRAA